MDYSQLSFDIWLEVGIRRGFIGAPVCHTHDGVPTSAEEDEAFEEGDDICLHVLRLYTSPEHKTEVEENHSPSQFRNPFWKK